MISVAEFDKQYNAVKSVAALTRKKFNVHDDHKSLDLVFEEQNIRFITLLSVQSSKVGGASKDRKGLKYELFRDAFESLGFGNIERFRTDHKNYLKINGLTQWLKNVLHYLLQEKQDVCARCGRRITSSWYGAFGFQNDHVAENFRSEGEASTKTGCVNQKKEIMSMILEMAQTQLTCVPCHTYLTVGNEEEIKKMVL